METKYAAAIRRHFRSSDLPPMSSLEIPDDYAFMDDELVELLESSVEPEIERLLAVFDATDTEA